MELISPREFAERLGVSQQIVGRGLRDGRIQSQTDPATGKAVIDWDTQEAAWHGNQRRRSRPKTLSGGRPRADGAPTQRVNLAEPRGEESAAEPGGMKLADIQRAREMVKLQIDSLELKTKQGELVSAAEVRNGWAKLVVAARTRIMGIPSACKQRVADLPLSVVATIEDICRETLEDLARGQAGAPGDDEPFKDLF